jgi:hypothetical protein
MGTLKERGTMNHRIILSAVGAVLCLVVFCANAIGYSGGRHGEMEVKKSHKMMGVA